jgi:hypothetical protein
MSNQSSQNQHKYSDLSNSATESKSIQSNNHTTTFLKSDFTNDIEMPLLVTESSNQLHFFSNNNVNDDNGDIINNIKPFTHSYHTLNSSDNAKDVHQQINIFYVSDYNKNDNILFIQNLIICIPNSNKIVCSKLYPSEMAPIDGLFSESVELIKDFKNVDSEAPKFHVHSLRELDPSRSSEGINIMIKKGDRIIISGNLLINIFHPKYY